MFFGAGFSILRKELQEVVTCAEQLYHIQSITEGAFRRLIRQADDK